MKTNSSNQEPLTLSATERKHVLTIRALNPRRLRAVLRFTASMYQCEPAQKFIKPEPTKRAHLSLVVDNGPAKPCA